MGRVKPTYVLCCDGMPEQTAAALRAATPPSWRIQEEAECPKASALGGSTLLVVKASQHPTQVRVQFTSGSSVGAFRVPVSKFAAFLATVAIPRDGS